MKIKIKNSVECNACHERIANYLDTCSNCGAFIRSRRNILNIWLTIFNLFAEPVKTMEDIIFVKRKSGIFILFLVMVIGFSLLNFIYMNAQVQENTGVAAYSVSLWLTFKELTLFLISYSLISKLFFGFLGYKSRIKDLLAVSVFAFIPFVLSIFLLLPVELGLFGEFWFTFNPFPGLLNHSLLISCYPFMV